MANLINQISIKNFKSLKDLRLEDCRRVNLLIGQPNVGKSNLLEALSLFSIPYLCETKGNDLGDLVRAENAAEFFFDGDSSAPIEIELGENLGVVVERNDNNGLTIFIVNGEDRVAEYSVSNKLILKGTEDQRIDAVYVLTYKYEPSVKKQSFGVSFLMPPFGTNLMETLKQLPELKEEINNMMDGYGLKIVYDSASQELKAMKIKSDEIFLVPFTSLADSIQRLVFNKAAIMGNHGKVICLEEPETHVFPPYIASVVQEIIASDDNQFFISTHSPYVANMMMESLRDELAIYFLSLVSGQTVARRATDEEVQEMYDNGVDMFFNLETYL